MKLIQLLYKCKENLTFCICFSSGQELLESGVKGSANSGPGWSQFCPYQEKWSHRFLLLLSWQVLPWGGKWHLEMTVKWHPRYCYSFVKIFKKEKKKNGREKYFKRKMSWLGKSMWAKVEKNMFFMFQQRPTICFFPVFSFLPENTSLCVLQTTSAAVTLWRSLYLPENTKTQQAPGWQSHLTPQHISCSALAALQSYFPHCTSPWDATEISQLSLDWTARDEVELKTCPIYSFIPIFVD